MQTLNQSKETTKHILLDYERLGAGKRALFGCQQSDDESDSSIWQELLDLVEGIGIGLPYLL